MVQLNDQIKMIVQECVQRRKDVFSQEEIANHLGVDRRKIIALERGECMDIVLIDNYTTILGKRILLITEPNYKDKRNKLKHNQ